MDGNAGDEVEVSPSELWRLLRLTQKAQERAASENRLWAQIQDMHRENDSLRRRLASARKKIKALEAKKVNARKD